MYQTHRVFCATPWEFEAERYRFYDLIGKFNERSAMPRGILFVPLTLPNVMDKRPIQYTVDENIRTCRHYLLILSEDWGPAQRNFRGEYDLALRAIEDPALPMKGTAVLAKELPSGASRADGLPEPDATFSTPAGFDECVDNVLSGWLESLVALEESSATAGCS